MADEYRPQQTRTQQMPAQHARQGQQQYQQQQYQPQQQRQYPPQYQQPQFQQPQMRMMPADSTTTGEWVLTLFLVCIPVLGFILMLVWAFSSRTAPSKKNWARANLVWFLIAVIITAVIFGVATALGVPVFDVTRDAFQNYFKMVLP